MRKNPPGYPLPSGVLGEDEIVCQLVYLPDRPEYWQALYSAIGYFATWKAWERDEDKRGKDAASDWRTALELTTRCWRMACLEEITDKMDDIIAMLALKKDCCDDGVTYGPGTDVETEIVPNYGNPPDYYGETAVTDWDDWEEHVCLNAHLYVDKLVWQANEMDVLTQLGGVTFGAVGAGLLLLSAAGLLIAVPYAAVALTAAGILAAGSYVIFLTTADDIEDAREAIVCALLQGASVSDVVENALGSSSLDWLLFFSQVPYDSATAIIYEGGYDGEYLPAELRDDCSCSIPEGYSWQDATEITATPSPNTFGRINEVSIALPELELGRKVATSASWACSGYADGASAVQARHNVYQTLAVRFTCLAYNGDSPVVLDGTCRSYSADVSHAIYYTYDVAEGIDEDWADTQSTTHRKIAGGHAKRAIDYNWIVGAINNHDAAPGADPIESTWRVQFLVWKV